MKIDGSTAWRSITQPISDRSLSDALAGLRHVELANECLSAFPAERDGHQSHVPPARDIHRASEYALHPPGTALGLLGVLLEGPLCNRHRQPTPASAIQNRPMTGLHPSSDCSSARFKALSCPLLIRGKCILLYSVTICYISPEIAV